MVEFSGDIRFLNKLYTSLFVSVVKREKILSELLDQHYLSIHCKQPVEIHRKVTVHRFVMMSSVQDLILIYNILRINHSNWLFGWEDKIGIGSLLSYRTISMWRIPKPWKILFRIMSILMHNEDNRFHLFTLNCFRWISSCSIYRYTTVFRDDNWCFNISDNK